VNSTFALDYARVFLLISCLLIAGKSDFSNFLVKNKHWIYFSPFAILLLILDVIISKYSVWNLFMVFILISIAASTVNILPNLREVKKINLTNYLIISCYIIGIIGLCGGILNYTRIDYYSLVLGTENHDVMLWWTLLSASLSMIFYILVWKLGLIQGGADIKALIWTTLLIPSWAFIPQPYIYQTSFVDKEDIIIQLPPSFILFLWGSSVFIIMPPIYLVRNIMQKNIISLSDLKIAWHAKKVILSEALGKNIWILSEVLTDDEGEYITTYNRFLPSNESENKTIEEKIDIFKEHNIEKIWVTTKHPFVTYLFIAIFPLIVIGDPIAIILSFI
jgi:hypothetical protein